MNTTNYSLKEQIRDYWSDRATTFDDSPGHCIRTDREMRAYAASSEGMLASATEPR